MSVKELLEFEINMKHYFENNIKLKPNKIFNKYKEKISCCFCEKEIKFEDEKNPVVKGHCYLTGKFISLAHDK